MRIIHFDICSLCIYLIILFTIVINRNFKSTISKLYTALVGVSFVAAISSILSEVLVNFPGMVPESIKYLVSSIYLFTRSATGIMYVLYIIFLSDIWHLFWRRKGLMVILLSCFLVVIVLLCLNPLNYMMFYYDEAGHYVRGDLYIAFYISGAFYFALGMFLIIKFGRLIGRLKQLSILALGVLTVIAVTIQYFTPKLMVEMFANAIALLIIRLIVQRPEDVIDPSTGLRSYYAYYNDLAKNSTTNKKVSIILIDIKNYNEIVDFMGNTNELELLGRIADVLELSNSHIRYRGVGYHLYRGFFRFVLGEKNMEYETEVANRLNGYLSKTIKVADFELSLKAQLTIIRYPEDINEYAELASFDKDISSIVPYSGNIVKYSELDDMSKIMSSYIMEKVILNAFENDSFEIMYQPVYSLREQRYVAAEVMLRINDEKYGTINQETFLPTAIKYGHISKIGEYVCDEVCKFIASEEFNRMKFDYIEISFSEARCCTREIVRLVIDTANVYGVDLWKINLNIPNKPVKISQNVLLDNMYFFINNNVRMTMSEYMLGNADILKASVLPFENVKITIDNDEQRESYWKLMKKTVETIKEMGIGVAIKGVRNTAEYDRVIRLECDLIQGSYLSKELNSDDLVKLICGNMMI